MVKDTHGNNDNEPNPWSSIGLQAMLIVNKLRVQAQLREEPKLEDVGDNSDRGGGRADEERERAHREYVESRLRETAAFERRARGIQDGAVRKFR